MIVSVNDQPAVCHNLTCDYTYTIPTGSIDSFTFSDTSNVLTIVGTNLPTALTDLQAIHFAKTKCVLDSTASLSATSITCTLEAATTCGSHAPDLVSKLGRIPNGSGVTAHTVSCTIGSASPLTGLNLLGGDNITVTGAGFPHHLDQITSSRRRRLSSTVSTVSLTFNDAAQTKCIPQSSTPTQIVCLTDAFDSTASSSASLALSINVNSQPVTNALNFGMKGSYYSTVSITPPSASPVLKTQLTV
jgi:hypothetical protein